MKHLKQISWDISKKSNPQNISCYNVKKHTDKYSEPDNIDSILEKIYKSGIEAVHFLGGNPLISKNMRYVLSEFNRQGIVTDLVTNGDKLTLDVFEKLKDSGLNELCVNFDGIEENSISIHRKDKYRLIINNLKNIREKFGERYFLNNAMDKPQISISHTITNQNIDSFLHFARKLYQIGVRNINLGFIFNDGNKKKKNKSLNLYGRKKENTLLSLEKAFEILSAECKDMIFNIELRPVYIKYLNMKYGDNFRYKTSYTKCMAYQDFLYLEANGDIHPCNVYSIGGIINFDLDRYMNLELNIKDVDCLSEALSHPRFELFHKMYKDAKYVDAMHQTFVPIIICDNCFVKEDCEPCPFQFYAREHYLECEIAFEYYIDQYDKIKDKIIVIPENSVYILDSQFNKIESKTVDEAVKKSGAIDLIGSVDWKTFQRILNLQKKGLINLE